MSVWLWAHDCKCPQRPEEGIRSLESQVVVRHLVLVLGTELGSSAKAASTLNHVSSPTSHFSMLTTVFSLYRRTSHPISLCDITWLLHYPSASYSASWQFWPSGSFYYFLNFMQSLFFQNKLPGRFILSVYYWGHIFIPVKNGSSMTYAFMCASLQELHEFSNS